MDAKTETKIELFHDGDPTVEVRDAIENVAHGAKARLVYNGTKMMVLNSPSAQGHRLVQDLCQCRIPLTYGPELSGLDLPGDITCYDVVLDVAPHHIIITGVQLPGFDGGPLVVLVDQNDIN